MCTNIFIFQKNMNFEKDLIQSNLDVVKKSDLFQKLFKSKSKPTSKMEHLKNPDMEKKSELFEKISKRLVQKLSTCTWIQGGWKLILDVGTE